MDYKKYCCFIKPLDKNKLKSKRYGSIEWKPVKYRQKVLLVYLINDVLSVLNIVSGKLTFLVLLLQIMR